MFHSGFQRFPEQRFVASLCCQRLVDWSWPIRGMLTEKLNVIGLNRFPPVAPMGYVFSATSMVLTGEHVSSIGICSN